MPKLTRLMNDEMSLSLDTVHHETNSKTVQPATPRTTRRRVDAAKIRKRLLNRRSGGTIHSESSLSNQLQSHKPPLRGPSSRQAGTIAGSSRAGHRSPSFQGDVQSPVDRFHRAAANVPPIRPAISSVGVQESTVSPMIISDHMGSSVPRHPTGSTSTEIKLESPPNLLGHTRHSLSNPAKTSRSEQPVLRLPKNNARQVNSMMTPTESRAFDNECLSDERSGDSTPKEETVSLSPENRVNSTANVLVWSANGGIADDDARHTSTKRVNGNVLRSAQPIAKRSARHNNATMSETCEDEYLSDERSLDSIPKEQTGSRSSENQGKSTANVSVHSTNGSISNYDASVSSTKKRSVNVLRSEQPILSEDHVNITKAPIGSEACEEDYLSDERSLDSILLSDSMKDAVQSLVIATEYENGRENKLDLDRSNVPHASLTNNFNRDMKHKSALYNSISSLNVDIGGSLSKANDDLVVTTIPGTTLSLYSCKPQEFRKLELQEKVERRNARRKPDSRDDCQVRATLSKNPLSPNYSKEIYDNGPSPSRSSQRFSKHDNPPQCELKPKSCFKSEAPRDNKNLNSPASFGIRTNRLTSTRSLSMDRVSCKSSSHLVLPSNLIPRAPKSPSWQDERSGLPQQQTLKSISHSLLEFPSVGSAFQLSSLDAVGHKISPTVLDSSRHFVSDVESTTCLSEQFSTDPIGHEVSTRVQESRNYSEVQSTHGLPKPSFMTSVGYEVSAPVIVSNNTSMSAVQSTNSLSKRASTDPVRVSSNTSMSEIQSTTSRSKPSSTYPNSHEKSTTPVQASSSNSLNGIESIRTLEGNRETIVSVLKSSSYAKPDVLSPSSSTVMSKDDSSVGDIRFTNTQNTAKRSNAWTHTQAGQPQQQDNSKEIFVRRSQSPIQKVPIPSLEDIDSLDSKSDTEVQLALDSFRLFEAQVDAQMREMEDQCTKNSDSCESSTVVSSKSSFLDSDHDSNSHESDDDSNSFLEPTSDGDRIVSVPSDEGDVLNSFLLMEHQMDAEMDEQMAATTSTQVIVTRDNDIAHGDIMVLRDVLTRRDEALACQDALIEKQRKEIAVLKMERDLLQADLKSSRLFHRSSICDDFLLDRCGRAVCKWSDSFQAVLKCE